MIDAMKQALKALELGAPEYVEEIANLRAAIEKAERQAGVFKLVNGEICYKSEEDDQSYGMWCPVTPDYKAPFPEGTTFYAAPVPQIPAGKLLVAWCAKNDITGDMEIEWHQDKPKYEGLWEPLFKLQAHKSICGDERPCINCFADDGPCLGPYEPKKVTGVFEAMGIGDVPVIPLPAAPKGE